MLVVCTAIWPSSMMVMSSGVGVSRILHAAAGAGVPFARVALQPTSMRHTVNCSNTRREVARRATAGGLLAWPSWIASTAHPSDGVGGMPG